MEQRKRAVESVGRLKISVIMLTYNREVLVRRAIKGVLDQTFKDFEYIIVDNGSTDRSGAIADEYAAKDSRIRVIHRERGNIGSGRNAGLESATGEYIAFIDDDDFVEPDFLEFLYNLITENEADVSICGATDKIFDEKRIMTAEEAIVEMLWRKRFNVQFPTKMFRHELIKNLRFSEDNKYDDIELIYKVLAGAGHVAYHGLAKYTFVRHEANNSAWTTNHQLLDKETLAEYLWVYRERTEWLSAKFHGSAAIFRYFEHSFMISMVEKISRYSIAECFDRRSLMIKELAECRDTFMNCGYALDFEKEWMEQYVR